MAHITSTAPLHVVHLVLCQSTNLRCSFETYISRFICALTLTALKSLLLSFHFFLFLFLVMWPSLALHVSFTFTFFSCDSKWASLFGNVCENLRFDCINGDLASLPLLRNTMSNPSNTDVVISTMEVQLYIAKFMHICKNHTCMY